VRDRDLLLSLTRVLLDTNLNLQDSARHIEEAIMSVMEQALTYLQQQMCQEQVDLIVCSIQQANSQKARAYTFHNRVVNNKRTTQMQRVADDEVIDGVTSANIHLYTGEPESLITDFNLSFKKDIILRKLCMQPC